MGEKLYTKLVYEKLLWKPMLFGPSGGINSAPSIQPPQPQSTSVTTTTMSAREGTTNSHPKPVIPQNSISLITNF